MSPSKKHGKVERTPQEELRLSIINTYYDRFNSVNEVARAYGVKPETAKNWIERISNDLLPVEGEGRASTYLSRREKAINFFEGKEEMSLNYEKTSAHNRIQDYIIKPGQSLPDNEVTQNAWGYQIIIKGQMKGKQKVMTSPWAQDVESALATIAYIMAEYPGFSGKQAYIRVIMETEEE